MKGIYEKPLVFFTSDSMESVYMASGADMTSGTDTEIETGTASGCYTVNAYIHQTPETGRETYVIQVNGKHGASHSCNQQILTICFNQPVTYVSAQGNLADGDGTNVLKITYYYYNNPNDNIGLGDLSVKAGEGLAITSASLDDSGHTW